MSFQFKLALRYLSARKLRTVLTTLAIVLGVMITFGLNALAPPLKASFQQSVEASSANIDLILAQKTMGMFDQALANDVATVPGVSNVTGAISREIFVAAEAGLQTASGEAVTTLDIYGVDLETGA
jgi:putative ABC transport system permease protein